MKHGDRDVDARRRGLQRSPPGRDGNAKRLDRQSVVDHPAARVGPPLGTPEPADGGLGHRQQIGRASVNQAPVDSAPQPRHRAAAPPAQAVVEMGDAPPHPGHPGEPEHSPGGCPRPRVDYRRPQLAKQQEESTREGRAEPAVVHLSPERADLVIKRSRSAGQGAEHQPELSRIEPAHQLDGARQQTTPVHGVDDVEHRPWPGGAHAA